MKVLNMDNKSIPKVELHAHLSGSISDETISKLISKNKSSISSEIVSDIHNIFEMKEKRSLAECFKIFSILHTLTDSISNIKMCTYDVIREFSEDNVWYLELRTTPKNVEGSYTKVDYIEAVLETVREAEKSFGIVVRILISLDRGRGVEDAWDTLSIVNALRSKSIYEKYIRGLDVSGNPNQSSLIDYLPILKEARSIGLKLAVHLLEVFELFAFEEANTIFTEGLVDRIGHGTFLHQSPDKSSELVNYVLHHRIPIEICITSNIKCGSVKELESHHVKWWRKKQHPVVICTDDKGVFSTTLSEELALYCKAVDCEAEKLNDVISVAIEASFLDDDEKKDLSHRFSNYINSVECN